MQQLHTTEGMHRDAGAHFQGVKAYNHFMRNVAVVTALAPHSIARLGVADGLEPICPGLGL